MEAMPQAGERRRGAAGWRRVAAVALPALAACGGPAGVQGLTGTVRIDGSSTVLPLTEAVAEEFRLAQPGVRVTVGVSGTGGGFQKFCRGETDINDASRPIAPSEVAACAGSGVAYLELPVALDGVSVVVNPANGFVDHLTVEELRRIWSPDGGVGRWSDVRPGWPRRQIRLYGPGTDSGTFDYFTEAIVGESGRSRPDYTASEDDNVLVVGVAGDPDALGYFGYAYFEENADRLKVVPIDGGDGPVAPTRETIADGSYRPLSRPLLIYVSAAATERPEVDAFVRFYLENAAELAADVGYVGLPGSVYELVLGRFEARRTGSLFSSEGAGAAPGIEALLRSGTE